MPVILPPAVWPIWLGRRWRDADDFEVIARALPGG
jgi:hypothetical protein